MPTLFITVKNSLSPILAQSEVDVTALNREEAHPFIKNYRSAFGQDPSDAEIMDISN